MCVSFESTASVCWMYSLGIVGREREREWLRDSVGRCNNVDGVWDRKWYTVSKWMELFGRRRWRLVSAQVVSCWGSQWVSEHEWARVFDGCTFFLYSCVLLYLPTYIPTCYPSRSKPPERDLLKTSRQRQTPPEGRIPGDDPKISWPGLPPNSQNWNT